MKLVFVAAFAATLFADVAGTIYVSLDIDHTTIGTGSEESFSAYIDSIRTSGGGIVYSAGECLHEYQAFRLHSGSRQIADLDNDSVGLCTGSPCYRSYYTHSSPADVNRDLAVTACYFLVPDSLDSAYAFSPSRYSFVILAYRPGNLALSLSERFVTTDFSEWVVVSDTLELTIVGPPVDCVPLKAPECIEVYDLSPLAAKGIWHHVMLHDGYQYSISLSAIPPASGIDIDTNYISMTGLAPETNYYLHVRAWANCESSGRSYSDWSSVSFNTLPQPETVVKTAPANLLFIADSTYYDSTTTFLWPYLGSSGPCHWLEAVSPQFGAPGPVYFFGEWSDGGDFYHCHRVGATNLTITCSFDSVDADFVSQTPPPSPVCAGATVPVSITMRNSGNLDWTTWDGITLTSQNPPMNTTWGLDHIDLTGGVVNPDGTHTFSFDATMPDSAGDYIFEWEMRYGSLDFFGEHSESVVVTVLESPVATASNDGPHCEGELANLFGGPSGMMYSWSGPDGFASNIQNPFLGIGTPAMSGEYRLVVTNGYGCVDTATTTLNIHAKPAATASNGGPYCQNESATLTAEPTGMTYSWSGPDGFSSSSRTPTIPDIDLVNAGTYTVIVSSSYGCADTATTDLVVNERPDVVATTNAPVCEGDMLELRANPSGLDSYSWIFPDSSIRPGRTHFFLPCTADMAGWYIAIGTNDAGCADTSSVYVEIDTTIKTLTIESLSADSAVIWEGSSTYLHCVVSGEVGDVSYSWNPMSSLTWPTSAEPLAEPESTTTYIVTVRDSQECGSYSIADSITISVLNELDCRLRLDTLTGDTVVCLGSSAQLHAAASNVLGSAYYNWTPATWLSSHIVQNPICTPESTIVYTVVAWDDSGCTDTASVVVAVDDVGISVEPDFARICRGDDVVIHAAATGGIAPFEWTWVPDYAILPPESSVVSAFPETTSIYRLIVTDSAGCSAEDTIMIVVDSLIASLTVEASAEETLIILGESTRLHAELSDPVGAIGYSWTPEEPLDIPHLPNPWAEPTESGWFVVTVTDSQGTCVYSATDSVYIRVEDTSSCPLSISDISPNSIVCRGDSIALWVEVDGAVGEVHYLWRPAEYLDDPTLSVPTAFPPFTTRFWVVVSDDSCSDSAYTTVAVDTLSRSMEIMDALATRDSIDIGDSTRLYALVSGVAGELNVHWSPEGDLSCPDSISTWASPITPTTYTLVAADSQRCGTHYDTARVFVYVDTWLGCSLSVAASGWDSICSGESALLSATAAGAMGDVRYSWSPTEGLDSPLSQTTFASPETTTLYTATAVDDSGCIDTASVVVWVKRIDEGALPPLDICHGDTIELPLSFYAGRPPISWLWNPSLFLDDSSAGAPRCFPESTITYSIIAIDDEGCLSTTELTIAVDSVVTTMSIALSPDTAIAAGGSAGLRASISGGVGSISHSWSPALWLDDPSSLAPTASPPTRTVYRFTAIDSQRCGAFAATDSVVVDILPAFECSLSVVPDFAESSICRGGSIALPTAVSGAMGAVEYSWHPASHLDDPHAPSPVASGLDSSMAYTVVATDDSCSDSATVLVFVKRLRFEPPMRICRGETLSLSAEFEFASEPVIWEWSPETGLSAPHESTSLAFPETTTTYSITATDLAGCTDSVAFSIEVDSVARTMEIEAIASPPLVLPGDSALVIVNIVGAAGDVSVRWFGLGLESPDDEASWATPPCSTWYFVSVFDSQECGIDTLTDSVFIAVVSAICSLDVTAGSGDTICRGDTASLFAECRFASGDVAWSWRPADDLDDPNIQNPSASPDFTTLYWAVASDSAGCVDSTSVLLIVHQPPMAEAYTPSDSIEAGNDIELNAFPEDESFAYLWAGPNGFSSASRCPNIEDADLEDAGWYFVDVTDGFGCTGTDSLWITVYRLAASPNIHATPSQLHFEIEAGGSETLPLVVGNSGDSILTVDSVRIAGAPFDLAPYPPSSIAPLDEDTLFVTFAEDAVGVYFDTLSIFSNDRDEPLLRVPLLGEAAIVGSPAIEAMPETLDFGEVAIDDCDRESTIVSNSGDAVLVVYQLDFPRMELRHLRPPLPDSIWPNDNRYFVFEYCPSAAASLATWIETATNDTTALSLLALGLGIEAAGYSVNTEIVSPNGDGKNDVFRVSLPDDVTDWKLTIYDSRGRVVFAEKSTEWDATQNGNRVPIGTYYYRLEAEGKTTMSGSIAVIF